MTDPIPLLGLAATTYCTLYVLDGRWSPVFVEMCRRAYGGPVPHRFEQRANEIRVQRRAETCGCGIWMCDEGVHGGA